MRFDPDLARKIMFAIEDTPANQTPGDVVIEGRTEDEIIEHLALLIDAGYLDGKTHRSGMGSQRLYTVFITGITWEGHEFIAAARSEGLWNQAKEKFTSTGTAISLSLIKGLLIEMGKAKLGIGGSDANL